MYDIKSMTNQDFISRVSKVEKAWEELGIPFPSDQEIPKRIVLKTSNPSGTRLKSLVEMEWCLEGSQQAAEK